MAVLVELPAIGMPRAQPGRAESLGTPDKGGNRREAATPQRSRARLAGQYDATPGATRPPARSAPSPGRASKAPTGSGASASIGRACCRAARMGTRIPPARSNRASFSRWPAFQRAALRRRRFAPARQARRHGPNSGAESMRAIMRAPPVSFAVPEPIRTCVCAAEHRLRSRADGGIACMPLTRSRAGERFEGRRKSFRPGGRAPPGLKKSRREARISRIQAPSRRGFCDA